MTLLFMEGFGGYQTGSKSPSDDTAIQWSSIGTYEFSLTQFESGSKGIRNYFTDTAKSAGGTDAPYISLDGRSTLVAGMLFYHNISGTNRAICGFFDSFASMNGWIGINASNRLTYGIDYTSRSPWDGTDNGGPEYTSSISVPSETWTYIETKIVFDNSVGTLDFWINGEPAGSHTGIDTISAIGNGTITDVLFSMATFDGRGWDSTFRITDLYIDDSTNHGPVQIWYQPADTAGANSDFTPSAGSNQDNVDEIESDGDTTYNESSTVGNVDSFGTSRQINTEVFALQSLAYGKTVSGSSGVAVGTISDVGGTPSSNYGPNTRFLTGSYIGVLGSIDEVDPDTAAAWTIADANNAEIVYNHTSSGA